MAADRRTLSADWLLWLATRLTADNPHDLARTAIQATLVYSGLPAEEKEAIRADMQDTEGRLLPSVARVIFQMRPLLLPVAMRFNVSRATPEQAARYPRRTASLDVPWPSLEAMQRAYLRILEFYGDRGKDLAAQLAADLSAPDPIPTLLAQWVPPADAAPIPFLWGEEVTATGRTMVLRDAEWWVASVPDPAQCRAMRIIVYVVWLRLQELRQIQATPDRYPHPVLPTLVLKHGETWRTHRPEISDEGMVLRSSSGKAEATFPGLLPEVAARLVDNPGVMAGLTARRLFRLLPRLAWEQAMRGVNPFNRLVFQGLQDLAGQLDIQNSRQIGMLRDILLAGQEWRQEDLRLPPLWQVWMPERMARGRAVSEIRIDVGEALCPGFVPPRSAPHDLRWLLPVLPLPDLSAMDNARQTLLEALQWSLLIELRQSAASGEVLGENLRLTVGQRHRAADRAGISRTEMERALYGHNGSVPWIGTFDNPGDAWLIDWGQEWFRLSESGAQKILLSAAERAEINRSRYRKR